MSAMIKNTFNVLCFCLLVFSCTTDDILPAIELSSDSDTLSEDSGTISITATLNSEASQDLSVPLNFSGEATQGSDYSVSASEIIISSGESSGSISISGLQDQSIEGPESLIITLQEGAGFLVLSGVLEVSVLDDDSDTDNDGVLDADDECPETPGDVENNGCPFLGFLINEVLYDPPSGAAGDANGDGTRDPNEDEFIEFFNSGPELDLSGYTISDADEIRHIFPAGSIIPVNGVLVVFGGGTPTGDFGGAIVQVSSESVINMTNAGDFVTLADPMGNPVLTFDIEPLSNNPNESYTRNPDITGDFVQHDQDIPEANGALFSPGTKLDGSNF